MNGLNGRQIFCLSLTWLSYASTYLLRKPLGVVKADLAIAYGLTRTELGFLDTALLLPYAFMQARSSIRSEIWRTDWFLSMIILASFGDKYGPRKGLAGCLLGSALSMVTFGFWNSTEVLAVLLFLNGTAQSTAWPNCVKSLTSWFSDQRRTTVFGLFGTSSFAGGIFGTALAVQLQSVYTPNLKFVFLIPSFIVGGVGILVYFFLHSPSELGFSDKTGVTESSRTSTGATTTSAQNQLTYGHLWRLSICMTWLAYKFAMA